MFEDLLAKLRAILAELKHLPDKRAHDERRSNAQERAASIGRPRAILVMCLGNICRSPYAEHKLRALLADTSFADVPIRSAGLIGPGRPAPQLSQQVAASRGLKLDAHVSHTLSPAVVQEADVVLVMATTQAAALRGRVHVPSERVFILGDFDPEPISRREIEDPYQGAREVFETSYARIDRCLEGFVMSLLRRTPAA